MADRTGPGHRTRGIQQAQRRDLRKILVAIVHTLIASARLDFKIINNNLKQHNLTNLISTRPNFLTKTATRLMVGVPAPQLGNSPQSAFNPSSKFLHEC